MIRLLPQVQFVLDTKQAHRAGFAPEELLEAMGNRVRHVHALDIASDGALCLPGQGMIDWTGLMAKLRAQGFDGSVILEPYAQQAADEGALRRSLERIKSCLAP